MADSPFTLDPTSHRAETPVSERRDPPRQMDEATQDDPADTEPPGGSWGAARVFGGLYLAVTALAAVLWVWTISVAGGRFVGLLLGYDAFAAIGLVWLVLLAVAVVRWFSSRARPGPTLIVPPLVVIVLVLLTVTSVPVRVRFEFARSDFDTYAAEVLTAAEDVEVWATEQQPPLDAADRELQNPEVPAELGGIGLRNARVVPEGLLIYDSDGAFFDDAGYAYLPRGEFPPGTGSFESPRFRSLGGGWYAFTSSW